jgi:hypothetical protein
MTDVIEGYDFRVHRRGARHAAREVVGTFQVFEGETWDRYEIAAAAENLWQSHVVPRGDAALPDDHAVNDAIVMAIGA